MDKRPCVEAEKHLERRFCRVLLITLTQFSVQDHGKRPCEQVCFARNVSTRSIHAELVQSVHEARNFTSAAASDAVIAGSSSLLLLLLRRKTATDRGSRSDRPRCQSPRAGLCRCRWPLPQSAAPRHALRCASSHLTTSQRKPATMTVNRYSWDVVYHPHFCIDIWPWPMTLTQFPARYSHDSCTCKKSRSKKVS